MCHLTKPYYLFCILFFTLLGQVKAESSFFISSVTTEAVSNVANNAAVSGGNNIVVDAGTLVDKGIVWAEYSASDDPQILTDEVKSDGNSPTDFLLSLDNLNPETRYEVRTYIVVDLDTIYGNSISFYALSDAPANQSVGFSSSPTSPSSLELTFDNPGNVGADGYLLLRREDGSYPDLTGIQNGQEVPAIFPSGTTYLGILNNGDSPYSDAGLDPNQQYHYSLIPFNYDGTNNGTYHFIYNPAFHSTNETTNAAASSDLVSGGNEAGNILYANYSSANINSTADALQVWSIALRDGGGTNDDDGLSTILTDLEITPGTGNTVSSWQDAIKKAALFIGGAKQGETTPTGNNLTFSGLNISAGQASSAQIDVYLTFNQSSGSVTDGQRFVFSVSSASVSGSGSQLGTIGTINSQNVGGVNRMDVVAQTFELSNYPIQIDSGAVFSLDISAIDDAGNKDTDANFSITISGGATLISSALGTTQNLNNGEYSWSDLKLHPAQTSRVELEVSGSGISASSSEILVLVPGVIVAAPATLNFCSQNSTLPLGNIRIIEGSQQDFQVGTDLWYTIELPNGYRFVDNGTSDILFPSTTDLSGFDKDAFTNSNRRYNFRFDVNSTNELDTIYITGLEVEKTGTGSDTLEIYREFTGTIPGETSPMSAVQFKNAPNEKVHGVIMSNSVENLILNSNKGSGPVCEGEEVEFTAYGATTYDFFINDILETSGSTFSTTALQNNDIVKVKGYIGTCVDSAEIQMNVQTRPIVNISSPNYGVVDQNNPNPILISSDVVELHGTPLGGAFSGTGVKKIGNTNFFDPEEAGVGTHAVRYNVTTGVCTVNDSVRFAVESPSGGNVSTFQGLEAKYCEDDDRSLLIWPYDQSTYPVVRYNGPGVVEDPVGSGNWYFDPKLALETSGPGLTSVYVTYGFSFFPSFEFNLPPQNTFVYAKPTVSFTVNHSGSNNSLPDYFCGNEQNIQLVGNPFGAFENRKIYFTISDLDNNTTDSIDANDPKVFNPQGYTTTNPRNFAITYNYTSQISGCFNSFSDTTTILPVPRAVENSDIQDVFYCEGEPIEYLNINSGNDHIIRWYDRDNGSLISELDSIFPVIFGTGQKQYEAAIVTNNLATCEGAKRMVTVTVNPKPNLTLDGLNGTGYCVDNQNPITITPRVNGLTPPIPSNVTFRWMRTSPDSLDYGTFTQAPMPSDYPEGTYAVAFSYTDNNNCSNTLYKPTRINPLPKVDFTGLDSIYCADASPATLTHIINTTDNPLDNSDLLYEIDKNSQGDFVNLGVRVFDPQSILAGIGLHRIKLTYTDNVGCSSDTIKSVEVLPLPKADFVVDNFCKDVATVITDSSRVFSSFAGDSIVNYSWNFGDGDLLSEGFGNIENAHNGRTNGTFNNPSHIYEESDDYTIIQKVETKRGCINSISKSIFIGSPPEANFTALGFCEGDAVKFTDQSVLATGYITSWYWDFGNGNTSVLQHPQHIYNENGSFTVSLNAYSELGCVDSVKKEIVKYPSVMASDLPYTDGFEGNMPTWTVDGVNASWQQTLPGDNKIPPYENTAWVTKNSDNSYNLLENSWVESPCFYLDQLDRPVINLDIYRDMELDVDGVVLQMTFDDGQSWYEVGNDASGVNWFNSRGLPANPGNQTTGINYGWTGSNESWTRAKYALDSYIDTLSAGSKVRFRIALASNLTNPGNRAYGGFAFDNFHLGSRNRRVLLEHFTNSNINGYGDALSSIENFIVNKDEELIHLIYHNSYPIPDEDFQYNPEDLETRSFYYGVSTGPVTAIDGYLNVLPFDQWGTAFFNNETLESSPFEISIYNNTDYAASKLKLNIDISSNMIGADTFNIYVALAERIDDLYLVREILPVPSGIRIEKNWTLGETLTESIDATTKIYSDGQELYLVAFLQNPYSKKIYQSAIIPAGTLPQIITKVPENNLHEKISVFPNPFRNQLILEFNEVLAGNPVISLFDEKGQIVYHEKIVQGNNSLNLEHLPPGVFILQITSKGNVYYQKLIKQ